MARPKSPGRAGALILSIQRIHAERIFNGLKQFELRKTVPQSRFRRVYLYETGGVGIVGCFDTTAVVRLPVRELWNVVGDNATPKERFFAYFGARRIGCAIPIKNPIRFPQPILLTDVKRVDSAFVVPMSSRIVGQNTKVFRLLETARRKYTKPRVVCLRRIRRSEYDAYIKLVTQEIAPKYDEITKRFAVNILRSERLGYDPNGILTVRKEVMAIENANGALIGFTTLTYKLGGSVKTGPTVLFARRRKLGWGSAARRAIAAKAESRRIRKLYCTCPDWDVSVVSYLLQAGYKIEAHLARHYTPRNGELVFGLEFVNDASAVEPHRLKRSMSTATPVAVSRLRKKSVISAFKDLFSSTWARVSTVTASEMIGSYFQGSKHTTYEEKPIALLAIARRKRIVGLVLLVPKRGGAVKALLMSQTAHVGTLHNLLQLAEAAVLSAGRRKLYFLHPIADSEIISLFIARGYTAEGVLRSPYRQGQDAAVYSHFL